MGVGTTDIEGALKRHTTVLASDEYEGRLPGTRGDSLTVAYIVKQYRSLGLEPAGPDGRYEQPVPMLTRLAGGSVTFRAGDHPVVAHAPKDMVLRDVPAGESSVHSARLIFVGYGIVDSSHHRDDYAGQDVRGQIVMMIAGVPPPRPADTANGRTPPSWDVRATEEGKVVAARARGAAAGVMVFDSALIGFGFSQLAPLYGDRAIRFDSARGASPPETFLYMRSDQAAAALRSAGQDLGKLESRAMAGVQPPLTLDLDVSVQATAQFRRFGSSNVIGKLEGTDHRSPGVVVLTAHWDHLGRDGTLEGDQIYNGAVDNAGGVAQLLEVARRMRQMRPVPGRTVLFIATTGEEEGQLGASYYVSHPSYPLAQTLANINLDFFLPWGRTRDVINYGPTGSTLDDIMAAAAREEGRTVTPDPTPEEGYWRRGDQYPFALAGVPSAFPAPGIRYVGRADDFGVAKGKEYMDRDYHQVSDEVRSDWDWSGAAQEVGFLARVSYLVATDSVAPRWEDSTVCPACRDRRNHPERP